MEWNNIIAEDELIVKGEPISLEDYETGLKNVTSEDQEENSLLHDENFLKMKTEDIIHEEFLTDETIPSIFSEQDIELKSETKSDLAMKNKTHNWVEIPKSLKETQRIKKTITRRSIMSKRSQIWKFYIEIASDPSTVICKLCLENISRGGKIARNFNTTNMRKHLRVKHFSKFKEFIESNNSANDAVMLLESSNLELEVPDSQHSGEPSVLSIAEPNEIKNWISLDETLGKKQQWESTRPKEEIAVNMQPFSIVGDIGSASVCTQLLEKRFIIKLNQLQNTIEMDSTFEPEAKHFGFKVESLVLNEIKVESLNLDEIKVDKQDDEMENIKEEKVDEWNTIFVDKNEVKAENVSIKLNKSKNKNKEFVENLTIKEEKIDFDLVHVEEIDEEKIITEVGIVDQQFIPENEPFNDNISSLTKQTTSCNPDNNSKKIKKLGLYICSECNKKFARKYDLKMHSQLVHNKAKLKCAHCDKHLSSNKILLKHIQSVHEKQRPYKCLVCDKCFCDNRVLLKHFQANHEEMKLQKCNLCNKAFVRKVHLRDHVFLTEEKIKNDICNLCDSSVVK